MNIPDLVRLSTEEFFSCPLDFLPNMILSRGGTFESKNVFEDRERNFHLSLDLVYLSICDIAQKALVCQENRTYAELSFLIFFSYPYLTTFEPMAKELELSEILSSAKRAFANCLYCKSEFCVYQTPGNVHSFPKHGFLGKQGSQRYQLFVNILAFSLDDRNLQDKLLHPGRFLCCFGLSAFFFFKKYMHITTQICTEPCSEGPNPDVGKISPRTPVRKCLCLSLESKHAEAWEQLLLSVSSTESVIHRNRSSVCTGISALEHKLA